jgi:hypothetical protein
MSTTRDFEELNVPGHEEMKALIATLSRAERATLNNPNFITEDEADLILSDRSERESTSETEYTPTGRRRRRPVA